MAVDVGSSRTPRADAVRNRQRVLDAAVRVFAERGTDATLNDVAHEAGVGVGTVYRKFTDKDALLDALFEIKIDQLVRLADEAATEPDPALACHGFVLAVMEARATDRGLGAVVMRTTHGESFAAALGRRLGPKVERLVDRARAVRAARAPDRGRGGVVMRTTQGESCAAARGRRLGPKVERLVDRARAVGAVRDGFTGQDVCLLAMMVGTVADHTRDVDPGLWRRYAQMLIDGTRPTASAEPLSPPPLPLPDLAAALGRAR